MSLNSVKLVSTNDRTGCWLVPYTLNQSKRGTLHITMLHELNNFFSSFLLVHSNLAAMRNLVIWSRCGFLCHNS